MSRSSHQKKKSHQMVVRSKTSFGTARAAMRDIQDALGVRAHQFHDPAHTGAYWVWRIQ